MRRVDVSALVVTWNSANDIAGCVDAALAQRGVELEVVVVDNASTDGTQEVLARYADEPRVRVLLQSQNLGYAEGNNLAAAHAGGRHLLLLNPDCTPDPDCAAVLLQHLESTSDCGAAAAVLRYPDGRHQSFLRRELTFAGSCWAFLEVGRRLDTRFWHGSHQAWRIYADLDDLRPDAPFAVDCPAAACVMLPTALVGDRLFNPRMPLFFNDAELYRRLRAQRYQVVVVPGATAVHAYGTSVAAVPSGRRRAEMVASLREYLRPVRSRGARTALWLLLVLDALVCMVPARTRPLARGTLGGLGLPGGVPPWLAPVPPLLGRRAADQRSRQSS
ncbi:MAG: glycosyl transferase [Frankiales bacterium]|nr:glycosyl transferase [Frankiales bacterium]